jgi:hypothetical protein
VTALEELRAMIGRWDDDAWVALANRGLLRRARKDLETSTPELVTSDEDGVEVRVGDHRVRFGPEGPATAHCSCPAATVCQHVVAAGLWLAAASPAVDPLAPPADLHAELMGLDAAALRAHAGLAGLRWATQLVLDLDADVVRVESAQRVVIALPSPRVTFRYAGGGLAGLVADVRLAQLEKHQVAAVLAYQLVHGRAPSPVAQRASAGRRVTDHTTTDSRRRLRGAVERLLEDTARLGAAHLSAGVHQRYETLAVWAQGAEYHRLALLLRRLADQVELLLERNARADEHALVDGCAVALALVVALDAAAQRGPEPARLVGRSRTSYDLVPSLDLVGLGGLAWRSGSGYHGLTCLFWWAEEERFLSWTDARPVDLLGFDPRDRWRQAGPWTGLASPAASAGAGVRLLQARLSPAGRLSGVESTHAILTPSPQPALLDLPAVEAWVDLERRARAGRGLLDEPDPLRDWVVLAPAEFGPATWDAGRQAVVRWVRDAAGDGLPLELRWSSATAHAVQRVEGLTAGELPPGTRVVARVFSRDGGLRAEPLSLLRGDQHLDALHFDEGAAAAPPRGAPPATSAAGDDGPPAVLPAPLADLRAWTLGQLERGTGAAASALLVETLDRRHRDLRGAGFSIFPAVVPGTDPATALLRSHFVAQQVAAQLA